MRSLPEAAADYDANNQQYPCAPGQTDHGRGAMPLRWNYNYNYDQGRRST